MDTQVKENTIRIELINNKDLTVVGTGVVIGTKKRNNTTTLLVATGAHIITSDSYETTNPTFPVKVTISSPLQPATEALTFNGEESIGIATHEDARLLPGKDFGIMALKLPPGVKPPFQGIGFEHVIGNHNFSEESSYASLLFPTVHDENGVIKTVVSAEPDLTVSVSSDIWGLISNATGLHEIQNEDILSHGGSGGGLFINQADNPDLVGLVVIMTESEHQRAGVAQIPKNWKELADAAYNDL